MLDDFPVLSNYGNLSAEFNVGIVLIEIVGFMSFFFQFSVRAVIKICLNCLLASAR